MEAIAKFIVTQALQGDKAAMRYVLAQVPKLPHDAFVEEGDGIYTFRMNEASMKALDFIVNDFANYEIPEEDEDGSPSSSS